MFFFEKINKAGKPLDKLTKKKKKVRERKQKLPKSGMKYEISIYTLEKLQGLYQNIMNKFVPKKQTTDMKQTNSQKYMNY